MVKKPPPHLCSAAQGPGASPHLYVPRGFPGAYPQGLSPTRCYPQGLRPVERGRAPERMGEQCASERSEATRKARMSGGRGVS